MFNSLVVYMTKSFATYNLEPLLSPNPHLNIKQLEDHGAARSQSFQRGLHVPRVPPPQIAGGFKDRRIDFLRGRKIAQERQGRVVTSLGRCVVV